LNPDGTDKALFFFLLTVQISPRFFIYCTYER
jgi:hypothetical protein